MVKTFKQLKEAYKKAVEEKAEAFSFDGHLLVTDYAKYLIQHQENEGVTDETKITLTPKE